MGENGVPSEAADNAVRARGRPRSADRDREIRDAAWLLITELGCGGLTFEAIAQRVGCSRSTLYRRYATKAELISHLLDQTVRDFAPQFDVDASPREKVLAYAGTCARMYAGSRGAALTQIIAASHTDPGIAEAVRSHSQMVESHYYEPMALLAPAASDRAIKLALHGLIGAILHHVATRRDTLSDAEIARMADAAIAMARA